MANGKEEPPFSSPIDHLDPTEVHRRDRILSRGNHPLAGSTRGELVSNLLQIIRKNGTRRTLSQLQTHNFLRSYLVREVDQRQSGSESDHWEITPEEDPGLPPRLIQFGAGIALQTNTKTTEPYSFQQIADHLLEIKNWYSRQNGSPLALESPIADPYFGMIWRELTTLRHTDGYQMLEKAYRAYKPWEEEMETLLGFSIEDAVYYTREIIDEITVSHEGKGREVAQWTTSLLDFSQEAIDIADESIWVPKSTLVNWCDDTDRFHNLLERLSNTPGTDIEFTTPADINPLEIAPFVRHGSEYMLPLPRTLFYSLANTFYYDLLDSPNTGRFHLIFGDWLEEWTYDCLSKIYPGSEIIRNYTYEYEGEQVEGDLLILYDHGAVVIECKGKKLRAETRKGSFGGIDALKEDVERGIGKAYHQADRLISGVRSGQVCQIKTEGGSSIALEKGNFEEAHRWIVLGESYGSIATRDFAKILDITPVPYVCDIYDLQVMVEVLDDFKKLLHYTSQRTKQTDVQLRRPSGRYTNSRIFSPDEIDYLGVYNRVGGNFPLGAHRITGAGDDIREDTIDVFIENGKFTFTFG